MRQFPVSTRREWVFERLRRDILGGKLPPGSRLLQQEIAARYGASIIPVREALAELQGQGLVSLRPHQGAVIASLRTTDIEDVYDLRAEIEPLAVRLSVPALDDTKLARMKVLLTAMQERKRKDTDWAAMNQQFHECAVSGVARPLLRRMLSMLRDAVRFDVVHVPADGDHRSGNHEHEQILEACLRRDAAAAARHTRRHILNTKARLLAALRAEEAEKRRAAAAGTRSGAPRRGTQHA